MKIELIEENDQEVVECPRDEEKKVNPYCRKKCDLFNGYKTDDDNTRNIYCDFQS